MPETENHDVRSDITRVEGSGMTKSMFNNMEILHGKEIS